MPINVSARILTEAVVESKLEKSGGTLTGPLVGTTFKSGGTAANTGFKLADGSDLRALIDSQVSGSYNSIGATTTSSSGSGNITTTSPPALAVSGRQVRINIHSTLSNCDCNCNCNDTNCS